MTSTVISIQGINTEIFFKTDATRDPSPVLLMMVPGNPGLVDFYHDFINQLYSDFGGLYDFIAGISLPINFFEVSTHL